MADIAFRAFDLEVVKIAQIEGCMSMRKEWLTICMTRHVTFKFSPLRKALFRFHFRRPTTVLPFTDVTSALAQRREMLDLYMVLEIFLAPTGFATNTASFKPPFAGMSNQNFVIWNGNREGRSAS